MELNSLNDSRNLAAYLVKRIPAKQLLILSGPLGAGKTTLTQQIAKALHATAQVSSPTYTLIHEYPTPEGTLVHIDAYRLPSSDALLGLGLEDYLDHARLVVVEWGEGLLTVFPDAFLLTLSFDGETRAAQLTQFNTLIPLDF